MNIHPLDDYILLKKYEKPAQKGSIIIPNDNPYKNVGVIIKTGVFCKHDWITDQESIVQCKPYSMIQVEGHPDYFLVKEDDIIAGLE